MGFHATIAAGTDKFGNERHKSAPRVRVTERVTGSAQVRKFHELAGALKVENIGSQFTDTMMAVALVIAGRQITRLTATIANFRKVSATRWDANLREMNAHLVVRKVNSKAFTGWQAELIAYGQQRGAVLAQIAKGDSINTNGERLDACIKGLNMAHLVARMLSA